ncbi:MAG: hypothetical protein K0U93_15100, partial [Gammaproteobacteria bacterium]|nr:hypothetical protein [Gammaproteobacteria bacterium]
LAIVWLGEAYALAGHFELAQHYAMQAHERSQVNNEHGIHAWSLRLLGDIASQRDSEAADLAESYYLQSLEQAARHNIQPLQALVYQSLTHLYETVEQSSRAQDARAKATELFRVLGMPDWRS